MVSSSKIEILELLLVEETDDSLKTLIQDSLEDDCNLADLKALLQDPTKDDCGL